MESIADARDARRARAAWALAAFWLLAWLTTVALVVLNRSAIGTVEQADVIDLLLPVGFAVIGTLVASRQPHNPVGWMMLAMAVLGGLSGVSTGYVFRSFHFGPLPLVAWVAWAHDPINRLVFPSGLATFFFLLFPDGRLPSRRWRWFAGFAVMVEVVGLLFLAFQRSISVAGTRPIPNPLGSVAVVDMEHGAPGLIWLVSIAVLMTAIAAAVLRTRRSAGELRQQLRWLAFAGALTGTALLALLASYAIGLHAPAGAFDLVIVLGFGLAVPVSGVAVLKHGLYELDVVITKTLAYTVLAAFFTAAYLAIVVASGRRSARRPTRSSPSSPRRRSPSRSTPFASGPSGSRTDSSTATGRLPTRCCPSSPRGLPRPTRSRTSCRGWRRPSGGGPERARPRYGCASAASCVRPPPGATRRSSAPPFPSPTGRFPPSPTRRRSPRSVTEASCSARSPSPSPPATR